MKQNSTAAGELSPGDEFAQALNYYLECIRDRTEAIAAFEKAQASYIAEVNKLPLPSVMRAPVVIVTDADSLEKVRSVLEMTTVGIDFENRITERMGEVICYRNEKEALGAKHDLDALGETALLAASMVRRGLERLIAAIGHDAPDTWEQAVARFRAASVGWDDLGDDPSDEEANAISDVWDRYRRQMLTFPVQTPRAFLEKVRLIVGEELEVYCAKDLLADAERLFGEEAAQ